MTTKDLLLHLSLNFFCHSSKHARTHTHIVSRIYSLLVLFFAVINNVVIPCEVFGFWNVI